MVNSEISLGILNSTIPIRSFQSLAAFSPVPPQESIMRKKKEERKSIMRGGREMHFGTEKGEDLAQVDRMEGTWLYLHLLYSVLRLGRSTGRTAYRG